MRRMVNDSEFFAVVKALCEAQDMMRNYERKLRVTRRQSYHDSAMVAARGIEPALMPAWERKVSPKPVKPTLHD